MKFPVFLLLILFPVLFNSQQLKTTEKRVEIDLKDGRYNEQVYTMGQYGVVVRSMSKDGGLRSNYYLHHDIYNTDLELYETDPIDFDATHPIVATFEGEESIYHVAYKRNLPIYIYQFDVKNKTSKRLDIELEGKSNFYSIHSFYVVGQKAAAIGQGKNGAAFLFFDLEKQTATATPIVVEGYKQRRTAPINLQYLEEANKFYLSLRVIKSRMVSFAYLLSIDLNGKMASPQMIDEGGEKIIKSITVGAVGSEEVAIAGTYGATVVGPNNGIYFASSSEGNIANITTYNFLDIPNYLSFLPERSQQRIENKKERKAKRGKELEANQLLVLHDLIAVDNDFLLITEAYYPTYRTETRTTYVNGKATTTTVQVFDGYQYTHAMIAKFNAQGELLWSQVFKMYLWYKPMVAKSFIRIAAQEQNSIQLVYADGRNIYSKSFSFEGEILNEKTSNPINTTNENDKVKGTNSNISFWYDKYFLSYGVQSIKNKVDDDVKRKRTVLFLNKVSFE
ncbi:MAG: hypothetical protein RIR94_1890 [Bacteroidota bacterium]|jgi:hypothetical protein